MHRKKPLAPRRTRRPRLRLNASLPPKRDQRPFAARRKLKRLEIAPEPRPRAALPPKRKLGDWKLFKPDPTRWIPCARLPIRPKPRPRRRKIAALPKPPAAKRPGPRSLAERLRRMLPKKRRKPKPPAAKRRAPKPPARRRKPKPPVLPQNPGNPLKPMALPPNR